MSVDKTERGREMDASIERGWDAIKRAYDVPISDGMSEVFVTDVALALAATLAGDKCSVKVIQACVLACRTAFLAGVERGQVKGVG